MKKLSGILVALILTLSIFTGCAKTEDIQSPTFENNISSEQTSENSDIATKETQSPEKNTPADDAEKENENSSASNQTPQNSDDNNDSSVGNKNEDSQINSDLSDKTVQDNDKKLYCTILIDCSTILDNIDMFDKNKISILPKDGIILNAEVEYNEGDTVFDVLKREARRNRIHIDYGFDGYVKGIANIYEKNCGKSSGWNYSVNGKFPSRSCMDVKVSENDVIKWLFTCDLGKDIGDTYYS